jgi:3-oxoacyl-[acyl-carrier-protein] synthase-3
VLAIATTCDNRLEGESRGAAFTRRVSTRLDFDRLRENYLRAGMPLLTHLLAMKDVLDSALKRVFDEAACTLDDIAYVVPATATYPQLRSMLVNLINVPEQQTTWSFGRTTGHVGAADHLLGLDHLLSSGAVGPGQKILLLGGGTGFSCTCAIVEVTQGDSERGAEQGYSHEERSE